MESPERVDVDKGERLDGEGEGVVVRVDFEEAREVEEPFSDARDRLGGRKGEGRDGQVERPFRARELVGRSRPDGKGGVLCEMRDEGCEDGVVEEELGRASELGGSHSGFGEEGGKEGGGAKRECSKGFSRGSRREASSTELSTDWRSIVTAPLVVPGMV